jgi:hypothetical protein
MNTKVADPRLAEIRLRHGAGSYEGEGDVPATASLCVMQWVAVLAGAKGGKITDSPPCASRVIGRFCISCNDRWNDENRQKLVAIIPELLDSAASPEVEQKRRWHFADFAIRTVLPWLCDKRGETERAAKLRALAPVSDRATAELARQEARSLREFYWGTWYAADAADAADAAAAADADAAAAAADAAAAAAAIKAGHNSQEIRGEMADLCIGAIRGALAIRDEKISGTEVVS